MKKKHMVAGLLVVIVVGMLIPAIRATIERHRRSQDMAILQKIGLKMNKWSMDNGETSANLTNKSFLAILASDELAFLNANRVTIPAGINNLVFMRAETAHGTFVLNIDGSAGSKIENQRLEPYR